MNMRAWIAAAAFAAFGSAAAAPPIEDELVILTPVGKSFSDPEIAAFREHARQRWRVDVRVSAMSAGTPMAYGQVVEWKGRPQADLFWGGEGQLFDRLAAQGLLAQLDLPREVSDRVPASIGTPKPVALRDPRGYWIGTVLESCGIAYHPRVMARLGVSPPSDWDDLLDPRLAGQVVQAPPTRSSSSHAAYEVILQKKGEARGWEWLERLGAHTGYFAPRSRDVASVVAKGEFAIGFAVPSYFAFEDRLAGFDIRYVAPRSAWISAGPAAILAGAKHPNAARGFVEFVLSDRGQSIAMERGLFAIVPGHRLGESGNATAKLALEFYGGRRSFYDAPVESVYDDALAQRRWEAVNEAYRRRIEAALAARR